MEAALKSAASASQPERSLKGLLKINLKSASFAERGLTYESGKDGTEKPRHDDETDFLPVNATELMLDQRKAENAADNGMRTGNRKFGVCSDKLPNGRT